MDLKLLRLLINCKNRRRKVRRLRGILGPLTSRLLEAQLRGLRRLYMIRRRELGSSLGRQKVNRDLRILLKGRDKTSKMQKAPRMTTQSQPLIFRIQLCKQSHSIARNNLLRVLKILRSCRWLDNIKNQKRSRPNSGTPQR